MTTWTIDYGPEKINVNLDRVREALSTARGVLIKEIAFNDMVKDNPAQRKAYEIHVLVLKLLEKVFADAFEAHAEHLRRTILHARK